MWQDTKNIYHIFTAFAASTRYGSPSKKLIVIGVTGTDGKTTTVNMIYEILKKSGKKVSMISTVRAVIAGKEYDTGFHVSSPDPKVVQKFARLAADNGDEFLVLEVTSHALDQHRFWGIKFDIGVITNVTHDHLEYHGSWENYFLTKTKLIKNARVAIINRDEAHFERLSKLTRGKVVSFGFSKDADFNLKKFPLKINIPGEFNILNALAALAACANEGIRNSDIVKILSTFSSVSGRMEEVKNNRGFNIIVDFASTPNSLGQALKTLKRDLRGRLIAVFGSAGKRDIQKRFLMAEISVKLADITVITAEDPRGYWEVIKKQMTKAAEKAGGILNSNLFIVDKRDEAIDFAINKLAKKGDTIGFFGKGHEKSINYDGKHEEAWDEFKAISKSLNQKSNIKD